MHPKSYLQLGCIYFSGILSHSLSLGILYPSLAHQFLFLQNHRLRKENISIWTFLLQLPSSRGFLNQDRKEYSGMSPIRATPERDQGKAVGWPGQQAGFRWASLPEPGNWPWGSGGPIYEHNNLPSPHWSRTLPFHGQLTIISIM